MPIAVAHALMFFVAAAVARFDGFMVHNPERGYRIFCFWAGTGFWEAICSHVESNGGLDVYCRRVSWHLTLSFPDSYRPLPFALSKEKGNRSRFLKTKVSETAVERS